MPPLNQSDINIIVTEFNLSPNDYKISNDTELVCACPQCKKEEHFYVNIKSKKYHCFKCGYSGGINLDAPEYVVDVETKLKEMINFVSGVFKDRTNEDQKWFDLWDTIDARYDPLCAKYLNDRGISDDLIEYYNIRYSPKWKRAVVPNKLNDKFRTDMYVARDITGSSKLKYLNPAGSASKTSIFNLHRVLGKFDSVIISEGVFSAISSGLNGIATYGKSVSKSQIEILCRCNFDRYYISAEADAIDTAVRLADILKREGKNVYLIELPEGKDANDLEQEEFLALVGKTRKYEGKFFVQSVLDLDRKTPKINWKMKQSLSENFRKLVALL